MLKKILCLALLAPLLCVSGAARAGEAEPAADAALACTFTLHEANAGEEARLSDGDVRSCVRVRSDRAIEASAPSGATQAYIVFYAVPEAPCLRFFDAEGGELEAVMLDEELLYQSCAVPSGSARVTLTAESDFAVSELAFYAALPETLLLPEPPPEQAELLLVVAHTGDESYYFGGLLPILAGEKGRSVQVLFLSVKSRLAMEEAMLALRDYGLCAQPLFMDFDYRLRPEGSNPAPLIWPEEEVCDGIAQVIRACRPEIVITHDPAGEDGDAMHASAGRLTRLAIERAADAEAAIGGAAWQAARLYTHSAEAGGVELPMDEPLPQFDGETARALTRQGFSRYTFLRLYHKAESAGEAPYYAAAATYRAPEDDPLLSLDIDPMPTPSP
ncbi:MAG: PIG-L family deacetylase, partial [Clostridia bacterium]|nr:PIG-L family deacetylase [Clostridia bacterium]